MLKKEQQLFPTRNLADVTLRSVAFAGKKFNKSNKISQELLPRRTSVDLTERSMAFASRKFRRSKKKINRFFQQ